MVAINDRHKINLAQIVESFWQGDTLYLVTTTCESVPELDEHGQETGQQVIMPYTIGLEGDEAERVWSLL